MVSSNSKGDRGERELVNYMDDLGRGVVRIPSSGSSTDRDLPDVLIGSGGESYAVEAKNCGGDVVYIDAEKVDSLRRFADKFGASARVAVKFPVEYGHPAYGEDRPGFYFFDPDDLYQTPEGNYRVKKDEALEHGVTEEDL